MLTLAFAIGLWRVLRPSGAVWEPRLVGLVGVGLMGAGLFVTDPLNGYPLGTPLIPTERTTHGILHDLFGVPSEAARKLIGQPQGVTDAERQRVLDWLNSKP